MTLQDSTLTPRYFPSSSLIAGIAAFLFAMPATSRALDGQHSSCTVNLDSAGQMKDIISNAMILGLKVRESKVQSFLKTAHNTYPDGQALLREAAAHFQIPQADLAKAVEQYRHINCNHGSDRSQSSSATEISRFATDVTLHVILHEIGHALIREFDLPVLGNEETAADAFATHFLTAHLPDRALAVLQARTDSLMIEAQAVPRTEWSVSGEHNSDARRAFQIAALAVAADPAKYTPVAVSIGMSDKDIRRAKDYGTEVHRSWRRLLTPLWMPDGMASREARVRCDTPGATTNQLSSMGLLDELRSALQRFDWHSQVTVRFVDGEGGASWSRSKRTVTVHSAYLRRFIQQGKLKGR